MSSTTQPNSVQLSTWMSSVDGSPTMALNAKAMALQAAGHDIVNLAAGEPDFDTPVHIREAAQRAMDTGKTHYTPTSGIPELREALVGWVSERTGRSYNTDQIMVTAGTKFGVYLGLASYLNPGDEVLVPAPYWVSYPSMISMLGGRQISVWAGPEKSYKVSVDDLDKAITTRTRGIIFNSPSNPTGAAYTRVETEGIAEWAQRRNVWILSDEIYSSLRYVDEPYCSIVGADSRSSEWQILADGFSKAYAMTGWRIGVLAASTNLIKAATRMAGQTTSCPSSISQYAALAAVTGPQDEVTRMRDEFKSRRDRTQALLEDIEGLGVCEPHGAFYFFLDVREFLGRHAPDGSTLDTSDALCTYFLDHCGIAVVPGEGFGAPGYIRLSYASKIETLTEAASRLKQGFEALK